MSPTGKKSTEGRLSATRASQSTFNLFFFRHGPGFPASSCSGRLDSISIVRVSALRRRVLRVLTRDRGAWCGPACAPWGLAGRVHSSWWEFESVPDLFLGGFLRSRRRKRSWKKGAVIPGDSKWCCALPPQCYEEAGRVWSRRSGCRTQQSCNNTTNPRLQMTFQLCRWTARGVSRQRRREGRL